MSVSQIKKNRTFNIFLISILSLGIGFYGFDTAFLQNGLGDEHMGDRSLPRGQIERFVGGYLEQYQIDQSHPEYVNIVNSLANQFKNNWRKTTQIAIMLEKEGFEPNHEQIKSAIHAQNLTEAELEKLAANNGISTIQLIHQASDEWRRSAFAALLKQSEIIDPYSAQVANAIQGQTRVFKRYQLNLPTPVVTDKEINAVYEQKKDAYQFPKTYQADIITIKGNELTQTPSLDDAKQYFIAHSSQKPTGEVVSFVIIKRKLDGALGKDDLKSISQSEQKEIIDLMNQGYSVYPQAHPFEAGLIKQDDYYSFKKTLEPSSDQLINSYHQILIDLALEKTSNKYKELVFTSEDLSALSKALKTSIANKTFTIEEIDKSWPKEEIIEYIDSADSTNYNSPILRTNKQSLIVLKLKNIQPAKQKSLQEAKSEIKQMLLSTKEENNKQIFALKLMQTLGKGTLPEDMAKQVTESQLTIHFNELQNYQFIAPIQNAFYIYQSASDKHPTFLVNSSVAQLDQITYPSLNDKFDTPPAYLAPAVGLFNALNS
jgi:arsenate reductase-like glutaredoxin family protein